MAGGRSSASTSRPCTTSAMRPETPVARRKAYESMFADPLASALRKRRPDLVTMPFVGDEGWIAKRAEADLHSLDRHC